MKVARPLLIVVAFTSLLLAQGATLLSSMQQKLHNIHSNGTLPQPDQTPTEFSEAEINAYFASGQVRLPAGVESVRFQGEPGVVTANARVDFDKLKQGRNTYNPLLSVFTGVHDVIVMAHARGLGGMGTVHVDEVSLDGADIPRFVLQLFAEKFLAPKYPNLGIDSRFALPDRIDTATVGSHLLSVTQK